MLALFTNCLPFLKMDRDRPPSSQHVQKSISIKSFLPTPPEKMNAEEKFKIVRSIAKECIEQDELLNLLTRKPQPICYDGFEPSSRMLLAEGVMKVISVNKLASAGCNVKIWIADWFAQKNNKLGGDLDKIQVCGKYMIEIWKAMGLNMAGDNVEFLWLSKEINSRAHEHWPTLMDIPRRNSISAIKRWCTIMDRKELDDPSRVQISYPCIQCAADIYFLEVDNCQLRIDQRRVNGQAREYCKERKNKPVILSHHMLPGLLEGQKKMSKSDPSSAIFMDDNKNEVIKKINNAWCPEKIVEGNSCLEYIKFIIFPWFNEFIVEQRANRGREKIFNCFKEVVEEYANGNLRPDDLKHALSKAINRILKPVQVHFEKDPQAKELQKRVLHA